MAKSFDLKLRDALRILPGLVKDRMQRVGTELEAYISSNMQESAGTTGDRASAGHTRNETDQLRVVSGTLLKAFVKGRKGYASRFEQTADGPSWIVGVDLSAIPYARIHELGGKAGRDHKVTIRPRPYIKPAIEGYQRDVMQNLADGIMERLFA